MKGKVNLIIQMNTTTGDSTIICKAQNINNQFAYVLWFLNNMITKMRLGQIKAPINMLFSLQKSMALY